MPASLTLSLGTLFAFLLVLARVGGAMVFVPLPGVKTAPEPVRIVLSLGFTLALMARWPHIDLAARHITGICTIGGWLVVLRRGTGS